MAAIEDTPMFCFQCEQTVKGTACTKVGVCTKDPEVAALQDHLIWGLQSLSVFANRAINAGKSIPTPIVNFAAMATFSTLTNVNFEPSDFEGMIRQAAKYRDQVAALAGPQTKLPAVATWVPGSSRQALVSEAKAFRIDKRFAALGKDRVCLQELLVYGLKGVAAYMHHAIVLGVDGMEVVKFLFKALAFLHEEADPGVPALLGLCLECGGANLKAMELLDGAHTGRLGHPEPTKVEWVKSAGGADVGTPFPGKSILVSGHDLLALEQLLEQIEKAGGDVKVYTHGEMLPAHGYPGLKKHKALVGHYGTAWQNQKKEFEQFPGPILMTTNCYIPAPPSYLSRVFSLEPVGGLGVTRIAGFNTFDFSRIIDAARTSQTFGPAPESQPRHSLTVGFGHKTVIGAAGTVLGAVKAGELRKIVLIGGCDGFEKERNYFTELAERLPKDVLILTLACGKFKINGKDYGTLGTTGLPRLLDMGQCNDSFSAIQVAVALAGALKTDVNSLPLSLVLSWFEQKAVAVLLTLLHLGIKNIYVGPRPPAFFTPTILQVLVDKFNLHIISTPESDLKAILS
jgi:hydroxylamine reductase